MSHRLPADQFVVGLVLNVLVLGLVGYLTASINPKSHVVGRMSVPLVSRIPLLGPALFDQPWVLYLVYPLVPLVWWLLYRTRWGLEVRADRRGSQRLRRLRVCTSTGCAARRSTSPGCSPGSAAVTSCSLAPAGSRIRLIGGRGYIAIAAVIFGGWTLKGTVAGCITVRPRRLVRADDPDARLQVDRLVVPRRLLPTS